MTSASEPPEIVDLAREPDFRLGGLFVSPSAARVRTLEGEQRVEPRVMEVLVVLARHAGRTVTRDQLIDACWGGRIVSDDAVSRVIAQVRALARSLEPAPFELETVPKVGFRLTPAVSPEFHDAAAPAPAQSYAPEAPVAPARRPARRGLTIAVVAAGLLLAIGAAVVWRFAAPGPARLAGQNGRVDVMAFTPRDSDPALQKVAADLSESLVRVLAGAGVQVAARPLPRDAAGSDAELRVAGTVERENSDYVVNAQVLDRRSGLVLWSDRFVRTSEQQQTSPGDVSDSIAAVLHCALEDRKPARMPVSTEAFGLYLNACAGVFVGNDWGRMLGATRRLVKVAPQFAGGHAMHSIAAANAAEEMRHSPAETAALHAEAKAAAEQALRLDPKTPKAYSGLALNEGVLGDQVPKNWFLIEQYLEKALKLEPQPLVYNEYSTLLRSIGRVNEAIELLRTSDARDPRGGVDSRIAMLLASNGDLAGAEAMLKDMEAATGASQDGMRWTIAFWWEDPKTALPRMRVLATDRSKEQMDCTERYLQQLAAAKKAIGRGLPASCDKVDPSWRARMLAREGDLDAAFAALKPPLRGGSLMLYYPEMKSVRRDPRFWPLVKSMGLVDYWQKSGHWPDFCAEPDLPYDCRKMAVAFAR